jgi:MFS family permease
MLFATVRICHGKISVFTPTPREAARKIERGHYENLSSKLIHGNVLRHFCRSWRIPFLLSIVMVGVGLWIRLGILETPVFQRILAENKVERAPTIEVFRRQPREIVLTALLRLAEQSPGYVFNAFVFSTAPSFWGPRAICCCGGSSSQRR